MNALLSVLLLFPAVVMYHRVDATIPGNALSARLTISPVQFADELRSIHRLGLRTIGIDELVRDAMHGQLPENAVLLTFDDGYGDQFGDAFPILRRFGDQATFFVNPGTVGAPGHLTWPQIVAMSHAGMSIECHGVDHVDLAELAPLAQSYQIDACVHDLSAHLQNAVLAFAYPSGAFDAQTIALERRAGVWLGFTTDPRFASDLHSPYQITRIRVINGMSQSFFEALLERDRSYIAVPAALAP
ncbi:MAG TPA: polysaccharide deacetylase family protein [Candidatus Nitrosotalea sp.]|nr:polysaccharide deacetylase family protein [Candidatus Nitrosotalea sp.]